MWIDTGINLPVRIKYTEKNGDTTFFKLKEIKLNEDIPEKIFDIEIPEDVKINDSGNNFLPG